MFSGDDQKKQVRRTKTKNLREDTGKDKQVRRDDAEPVPDAFWNQIKEKKKKTKRHKNDTHNASNEKMEQDKKMNCQNHITND